MSIKESALTAITSIAQSDFVRAVTSAGASRRITVANLAKAIVESYTGSSLGGSSQSIKSVADSLKTNLDTWYATKEIYGSAAINNANNAPAPSVYVAYTTASNVPQQGILYTWGNNSGSAYKSQLLVSGNKMYSRTYTTNSGWSSWYRFDGTEIT